MSDNSKRAYEQGVLLTKTPLRTCTVVGCTSQHHSHGLCAAHARKRLHAQDKCIEPGCNTKAIKLDYCRRHEGRLLTNLAPGELEQLLDDVAAQIVADPVSGCWLWTGSVNSDNYGRCKVAGKDWSVHRLMYLIFIGTHPQTRELDHLCGGPSADGSTEYERRRCVNPRHLEPVTAEVNGRRRARRARHPGADFWVDADDHGKTSIALILWAARHGLPGAVPGHWRVRDYSTTSKA